MRTTWPDHCIAREHLFLQAGSVVVLQCWVFCPAIWCPVSGGGIWGKTGPDIWCGVGRWSIICNHTVESSWLQHGICWFWLAVGWHGRSRVVVEAIRMLNWLWTTTLSLFNFSVKSGIRGEHAVEIAEAIHSIQRGTVDGNAATGCQATRSGLFDNLGLFDADCQSKPGCCLSKEVCYSSSIF